MTDTDTIDIEAEKARADAAWWAGWWDEDFSWDGLAEKPWKGWSVIEAEGRVVETADAPESARQANLQDYWRWDGKTLRDDQALQDLGLLEDHGGQPRFHICHLPERWKAGSDSWKTDPGDDRWDIIKRELMVKIGRAAKTEAEKTKPWEAEKLIGPDRRLQLAGAQIRSLPRPPAPGKTSDGGPDGDYHLDAPFTRWLEDADFQAAVFGSMVSFHKAQFSGGDANFYNAQFSGGDANFFNAQFSGGDANFQDAQFSGGYANFFNAQFSGGYANFFNAQFSGGYADFRRAQFSGGYANFFNAQFSSGYADFRRAQFSGGYAFFRNAQFSSGYANFINAQFSGGDANFYNAQFSGGYAFFQSVVFGKTVLFSHLNSASENQEETETEDVKSDFDFSGSRFKGRVDWRGARFPGAAVFADVIFEEDCFFGQARQSVDAPHHQVQPGAYFFGPTSFRNALFKRTADFARCRFPDKAKDRNGLFEGCRFNEVLDLKGVERLPFSAFQGIRLDQGLSLDPAHPHRKQFEDALADARASADRDEHDLAQPGYDKNRDPDRERRGTDNRFAALEAGCRVLKTQMARDEDRMREQVFYTFELRAREMRPPRNPDALDTDGQGPLSPAARAFSRMYGAVSNYGTSIYRPLGFLALYTVLFMLINLDITLWFYGFGSEIGAARYQAGSWIHPAFSESVTLAVKNALGPLRFLAGNSPPFAYLGQSAPGFRFLMLISSVVQALISSILIFLSLLALRRNFQIS